MINAVLFDMDGLMFDTERLAQAAWGIAGRECGIGNGEQLIYSAFGRSHAENAEMLRRKCGENFPVDRFFARQGELMDEMIRRDGLPVKPGLYELLDFLDREKIPRSLATSTRRPRAMYYLELTQLAHRFDALATGDMVSRGKPFPDIFLKAAGFLNAAPATCLVLEDSMNGIHAAHAGGMQPFMVPDLAQPDKETEQLLAGRGETLLDVIPFICAYR